MHQYESVCNIIKLLLILDYGKFTKVRSGKYEIEYKMYLYRHK